MYLVSLLLDLLYLTKDDGWELESITVHYGTAPIKTGPSIFSILNMDSWNISENIPEVDLGK